MLLSGSNTFYVERKSNKFFHTTHTYTILSDSGRRKFKSIIVVIDVTKGLYVHDSK